MKRLLCVVALLMAGAGFGSAETLTHVRIHVGDGPAVADKFQSAGWDVLEGSITAESLDLIVTAAEMDWLVAESYFPVVLAVSRPYYDIQREQVGDGAGYPDLAAVIAELQAKAAQYPNLCKFVDLTAAYAQPATFENRHMYAVKVSDNVTVDEDEPAFLIVAEHHAREIVTPVIALYALDQLLSQYGADPTITAIVDRYEIWICPVWNPDGYNYVFTVNNMWRKNRTVFAGGIGCDQNRNYPLGWYSSCSGSTTPSSETYKGPSPASESETKTMLALGDDRHFGKVLDFHSSGREVLYSYRCITHPLTAWLQTEAAALGNQCAYGIRTPSADGEHPHWHLGMHGAHAFLMETATSFQPAYATAQAEAVRVWPAIRWFFQRPYPLMGRVTDAQTGAPVVATITIDGLNYTNGEVHKSNARFGRYHLFLPPGARTLHFAAEGYVTRDIPVTITTAEQVLDVGLSRPFTVGDMNCDGVVNFDDINPFVLALSDRNAYEAAYPNCRWLNADVNGDGVVNFDDINPFVALLTNP
ncbi:MAG: M14 family zinc carboxypeptidase [Planctomycetota bacterium]